MILPRIFGRVLQKNHPLSLKSCPKALEYAFESPILLCSVALEQLVWCCHQKELMKRRHGQMELRVELIEEIELKKFVSL